MPISISAWLSQLLCAGVWWMGETIPDFPADLFAEQVRHGFTAVDVENCP